MPGLAAAGFKPAVYTNFTTLAHRRMILEDNAILKAVVHLLARSNVLDYCVDAALAITAAAEEDEA